ncbi:MAG: membrane protein insertion efficiency factor YidD [Lutispora sp.]|nr:membrane protein insertion efficiency factor YidD [Lutispora sp.]
MKHFIIFLIKIYQLIISPMSPGKCRFVPTCSNYTIEAVKKYGGIKGTILGIKRVLKCHPFNSGGYDPLP